MAESELLMVETHELQNPMSRAIDGLTAEEVVRRLDLKPHPEGGFYRETFRDPRTDAAPASLRRRMANAPHASPKMNAESISSNECVAEPSTSDNIRIQPIS